MPKTLCNIYLNTGFNATDIPDSPSLLATMDSIEVEGGIFTRQDLYKSEVKVPCTWDQVKDADYVQIDDSFYTVDSITMKSPNTAVLSLTLDGLTTAGGAEQLDYTGWCQRRHVTDDSLFANNYEEPFDQGEPWYISVPLDMGAGLDLETKLNIIGSTINLTENDGILTTMNATTYTDDSGNSVTVPTPQPAVTETELSMNGEIFPYKSKIPGVTLYAYDVTVKAAVAKVRALGAENCIIYAYTIPAAFCNTDMIPGNPVINSLSGVRNTVEAIRLPYRWSDSIKNNKVFCGQFSRYVLVSTSSGCEIEYKPEDIKIGVDEEYPSFIYFTDPSPEGRVYYRAAGIEQDTTNLMRGCITGSTWQQVPLVFNTTSGSLVDQANLNLSLQTAQNKWISDSVFSVINASARTLLSPFGDDEIASALLSPSINNVAGAALTMSSIVQGYVNRKINKREAKKEFELSHNVKRVDISVPLCPNVQNYTSNSALVFQVHLRPNDAARLDAFFTAFGYATSEPMTNECFIGRTNFNYVQADASIITAGIPLSVRKAAESQLSNGVRVWHVKPDPTLTYTDNPITEAA